jgi:hypothetical protein
MWENGVCQLHEYASFVRKILTQTKHKVKTTFYCHSSCVGIFVGGIWIGGRFQTRMLSSIVMQPA